MKIITLMIIAAGLAGFYNGNAYAKMEESNFGLPEFFGGESKEEEEDYQKIIAELNQAIALDPSNFENYLQLASAYEGAGDLQKEAETLQLAVQYMPDDFEDKDFFYGQLAYTLMDLGRLDEAKPFVDKTLELSPGTTAPRMVLITYYVFKKQYAQAASELKILSEMDRESDYYHSLYSFGLEELGDLNELVELFREGVNANPDSAQAHKAFATALRSVPGGTTENFPAVIEEYTRALELDPQDSYTCISIANAYVLRARATKDKKYYTEGLRWFDKARKLDPDNLKLEYAIGNAHLLMDEYDQAIKKLEYAAYRQGHDEPQILRVLASAYNNKAYDLYTKGRNLKKALTLIDKALRLNPDDGIFLGTKAEILYKLKQYDQAYQYIKKALALELEHEEMQQDLKNIENALQKQKKTGK